MFSALVGHLTSNGTRFVTPYPPSLRGQQRPSALPRSSIHPITISVECSLPQNVVKRLARSESGPESLCCLKMILSDMSSCMHLSLAFPSTDLTLQSEESAPPGAKYATRMRFTELPSRPPLLRDHRYTRRSEDACAHSRLDRSGARGGVVHATPKRDCFILVVRPLLLLVDDAPENRR